MLKKQKSFFAHAVLLGLFLMPVAYIGLILATASHEILGHGFSAIALGGTFQGFVLKWDGMGWAFSSLPFNTPITSQIVHLAAGVTASTILGFVLLIVAHIFRSRLIIRLPLLILSFCCIMEGVPYVLWNSYYPLPPGDIGSIITLLRDANLAVSAEIRLMIMILSGIMFLVMTLFFCALLLQSLEEALFQENRPLPKQRIWLLIIFVIIPGFAAWFMFDWNQLAPGIGLLPSFAGAGCIFVSACIAYYFPLKPRCDIHETNITWFPLFISYGCLISVLLVIGFWSRTGVMWG